MLNAYFIESCLSLWLKHNPRVRRNSPALPSLSSSATFGLGHFIGTANYIIMGPNNRPGATLTTTVALSSPTMSALNFIQAALSLASDLLRQVFSATSQYGILPQSFSGLLRFSFTLYHLLFCLCCRSILPWSSTEDPLSSCTRVVAECQHCGTVGFSSAQYDRTSNPVELSGQLRLFEPSIQSYSDHAPNRKPPPPNAAIMEDIDIIARRRIDNIINGPTGASNISAWWILSA
jgi:hypothetical protein